MMSKVMYLVMIQFDGGGSTFACCAAGLLSGVGLGKAEQDGEI